MQSRILKTDALALRVSPFSRTSHVVRWLTASHGTIATLVKGACRPKSRFLGQYDTACTSELLFYERAGNGLHIAKECCLLEPRLARKRRQGGFRAVLAHSGGVRSNP